MIKRFCKDALLCRSKVSPKHLPFILGGFCFVLFILHVHPFLADFFHYVLFSGVL